MEVRCEPLFLSPRHLEVVCRTPDLLEDPEEAKDLKASDKTAIQLEKSAERSRHTDDALPVQSEGVRCAGTHQLRLSFKSLLSARPSL